MAQMIQVVDRFGNELQCGDFVCFTSTSGIWRQTPELQRVKIEAFITDKKGDWIMPEPDEGVPSKVLASRVIKCY